MTILSAGYGNRSFEEFIQLLKSHGVTHVVDVRSVPYSNYQAEFRRENLVDLIPKTGLKYVYMGDTLGGQIARAAAEDASAKASFDLGLERLSAATSDPAKRLCLMCGCLLPDKCHRGLLLGAALTERGVEYLHIGREGGLFEHSSLAIQEALF